MLTEITTSPIARDPNFHGLKLSLSDNWMFIGVHGGGERAFDENHPTFQLFSTIGCSRLFSFSMPLHNTRSSTCKIDSVECDKEDPPSVKEFLDAAFDVLAPIVTGENVIFLGHSGGGMTIQRNWYRLAPLMSPHSIVITVGSGTVETECAGVVNSFWTIDNFNELGTFDILSKIHGNSDRTARLIKFWSTECGTGGSMYMSKESAEEMFVKSSPDSHFRRCFMIIGDKDEAFPIGTVLSVVDSNFACNNVKISKSGHFTYFSGQDWISTRKSILEVLLMTCPLSHSSDEDFQLTKKKPNASVTAKL